jgi:hypothetical protein
MVEHCQIDSLAASTASSRTSGARNEPSHLFCVAPVGGVRAGGVRLGGHAGSSGRLGGKAVGRWAAGSVGEGERAAGMRATGIRRRTSHNEAHIGRWCKVAILAAQWSNIGANFRSDELPTNCN